jgi:hypothetical protein
MKRTTIFIDEALETDLRLMARMQQSSVASVVREAIEEYVRKQSRKPALSFVGIGRSGHRDTATLHEQILWNDATNKIRQTRKGIAAPRGSRRKRG